jgi:hypothetical protein
MFESNVGENYGTLRCPILWVGYSDEERSFITLIPFPNKLGILRQEKTGKNPFGITL